MSSTFHLIIRLIPLVLMLGLGGWFMWNWLRRSDEPLSLIGRWIATAIVMGGVLSYASRVTQAQDDFGKGIAVILSLIGGVIMTLIWRQQICDFVGDLFGSLYTGGSQEVDPAPFYSIALAKRKMGKYQEAIAEVEKQLERFPTDFPGWMLLAEIQAEDLKDVESAVGTVDQLLAQAGHAPKNIAFALNRVADWHLKLTQNRESAQAALERITELLPSTEQEQLALQRIAHLTPVAMIAEQGAPHRFALPAGQENIGLQREPIRIAAPEEDPGQVAAKYVQHLEAYPYDSEAREKLALLYAHHYQRLDMATDQLEQLISFPNQPAKQVVHWLNLLADLQVKHTGTVELSRLTLQRIVDLYPKSAAAENALNRLAYLKLELRSGLQKQAIKMGTYEQNLGLKGEPGWKKSSE